MIIVLMRIFVCMISMGMIMSMCREELFYKIDDDESHEKCEYCILCLFERLRKYMHYRYCEHRSCTKCDESIDDL
jgi:hypothetical protein